MKEFEFDKQLNDLKKRVTNKEKDMNTSIKLFEDKRVRTAWNEVEEQWYFSIVDVISILIDSLDSSAYWRKLKQRLRQEGNETVTNCHTLKIPAADRKNRLP